MSAGRLIVFEGGEGVGKTTNIDFVRRLIDDTGIAVTVTREPGGTALGERLRELLLACGQPEIDPETELLLMFAARAQHWRQMIQPALARGEWVLCDRFTDASYAYQGGGRGIDRERIAALEQWLLGDFRPHRVFVLDAPVATGLKRAGKRSAADRFEQETVEFFERVRNAYLERAAEAPARYRVIDAARPLDTVQAQLASAVEELLDDSR